MLFYLLLDILLIENIWPFSYHWKLFVFQTFFVANANIQPKIKNVILYIFCRLVGHSIYTCCIVGETRAYGVRIQFLRTGAVHHQAALPHDQRRYGGGSARSERRQLYPEPGCVQHHQLHPTRSVLSAAVTKFAAVQRRYLYVATVRRHEQHLIHIKILF